MIKSMTGYGRAEKEQGGTRALVEIKAVNHRYAEVVVRLPRELMRYEDAMKKAVLERVSRGRIDVFLTVEKLTSAARTVRIDEELAMRMKQAADALAERLGLNETLTVSDLLRHDGVLSVEEEPEDEQQLESFLIECTVEAVDSLIEMRRREGERLQAEFALRLGKLSEIRELVAARSPQVAAEYRERLQKRLAEALEGKGIADEARLLTEVALFVDRSSIDEELVRLSSHLAQFEEILLLSEPVGRKLDFLVQEMNREVNTIGSKANDLQVASAVVEAKSVLEQIREQIQNVE